jgi:hypothetical protein
VKSPLDIHPETYSTAWKLLLSVCFALQYSSIDQTYFKGIRDIKNNVFSWFHSIMCMMYDIWYNIVGYLVLEKYIPSAMACAQIKSNLKNDLRNSILSLRCWILISSDNIYKKREMGLVCSIHRGVHTNFW